MNSEKPDVPTLLELDGDLTGLIRRYKKWLLRYNPLTDVCGVGARGRLSNKHLETFENNSRLPWIFAYGRRIFRTARPSSGMFEAHFGDRPKSTLFIANNQRHDTILMLLDIDNKEK